MPLKPPLTPQYIAHQQFWMPQHGSPFDTVIRAHNGLDMRLLNQRLERGQVRLVQVLKADLGVKFEWR